MSDRTTLSERLKEAREEQGLTLQNIADGMAVSLKTVRNWEAGRTSPRPNKLHLLSGMLGVPMLWLLGSDEEFHDPGERLGRIARVEQMLDRMNALQNELSRLSAAVSAEVSDIRKTDEELESLVA